MVNSTETVTSARSAASSTYDPSLVRIRDLIIRKPAFSIPTRNFTCSKSAALRG
jgi:hypothetical protein